MPFFFLFARLRVFTDVHYSPLWFRNLKLGLKDVRSSFIMDSAWVTFEEEFERCEETSPKISH